MTGSACNHSRLANKAAQRVRAKSSHLRFYCELTKGKFPPMVVRRWAQHQLERQAVGLVPLPKAGSACGCGSPSSVAHVAFECNTLSGPRSKALEGLDKACSDLGVGGHHRRWDLDDTTKPRASCYPSKGTIPSPLEKDFFSRAAHNHMGRDL